MTETIFSIHLPNVINWIWIIYESFSTIKISARMFNSINRLKKKLIFQVLFSMFWWVFSWIHEWFIHWLFRCMFFLFAGFVPIQFFSNYWKNTMWKNHWMPVCVLLFFVCINFHHRDLCFIESNVFMYVSILLFEFECTLFQPTVVYRTLAQHSVLITWFLF